MKAGITCRSDLKKNRATACAVLVTVVVLVVGLVLWSHYDWAPLSDSHGQHSYSLGHYYLEQHPGSSSNHDTDSTDGPPIHSCPCHPDAFFLDNGRISCLREGSAVPRDVNDGLVLSLCFWTDESSPWMETQIKSIDDWTIVLETTSEDGDVESAQTASSPTSPATASNSTTTNTTGATRSLRHDRDDGKDSSSNLPSILTVTPIRDGLPNVYTHVRFRFQNQRAIASTHLTPQLPRVVMDNKKRRGGHDDETSLNLLDMSVHLTTSSTTVESSAVLKLKRNK